MARQDGPDWLVNDDGMAGRIRAHDWRLTPLGPIAAWPATLRTMTAMILDNPLPMALLWGPQAILLYNDACRPLLGGADVALGLPFPDGLDDAWSDYTRSPVKDERGVVVALLHTAVDTTRRLLVERRQRADGETRLRTLTAMGGLTFFRASADWGFLQVLDGTAPADAAESAARWADRYIPEDDRPSVAAAIVQAIATASPFALDHRVRLSDGGTGWVSSRALPILAPDGRVVEWLGSWTDITNRRRQRAIAAFLDGIGQILARTSDPHAIMQAAAEAIGRFFDLTGCHVCDIDDATAMVTVHRGWTGDRVVPRRQAPMLADVLTADVVRACRAGETVVVRDTATDARADHPASAARHIASFAIVPLLSAGRWTACLAAMDDRPRDWHPDDLALLKQVSERLFERVQQARAEGRLRESEARHRLLIGRWAQAVWEADPDGMAVADSPSWRAYTGQTLAEWLGDGWLDAIHPVDRAYAERQWRDAIAARGFVDAEFRLRSHDGGWRWTNVRAAPVVDADGRVEKWAGMNIDIHDRRMAQTALDSSERFSRALVEGVPQLIWRARDCGEWTWASPQWTAFTGQSETDSHGLGWLDPFHPDDRAGAMRFWQQAQTTGRLAMEGRLRHAATGTYRWFQTRAMPVRDADDAIVEWLGTSTDIDDLRTLQDRQQVLVAELQHRVRNILTVVRSVFTRTSEGDAPLAQVIERFRGRLDNLARTQVVVTRHADGAVDLRDLIDAELLSVGAADGPGVTLDGPPVLLDSKTAEAISLAAHELTTNAVKYGALAVAGATLAVRWSADRDTGFGRTLTLIWTEDGVPIAARPARRGFGSELIAEALPYQLGAETSLEFRATGVRCTIRVTVPDATAIVEPWGTA